jgi:hypothetical protein
MTDSVKIYPHSAVAFFAILKHWVLTLLILFILHQIPSLSPRIKIHTPLYWTTLILLTIGFLYSAYALIHYTRTYIQITPTSLNYNSGWIPNKRTVLLWYMIKDIETAVSIPEGLLGTGSITLIVVIRNQTGAFRIKYIPNHLELSNYIQTKITGMNTINYT